MYLTNAKKNINSFTIIRRVIILHPEQCLDAVYSVSKNKSGISGRIAWL